MRVRRSLTATAVLVLGIIAVIVVAVWAPPLFVPDGLTTKDAATIENNVRGNLLQGLLGAAFLLAAYFTWRQVQIAERGQITERFKSAVDQLGSENPDVRLGGIYSMEQIAKDNPKTYRTLMIEILGAFLRRRSLLINWTDNDGALPVDVDAVLTVLARRKNQAADTVDLARAKFDHADLSRRDLRGVNLFGADLSATDLSGTDLSGANLSATNLSGANLSGAELVGVHLIEANLSEAYLAGAVLSGAYLGGADLGGADLTSSHLTGADLAGANLTHADLHWANLTNIGHDEETKWPEDFEPPPSR